MATGARNNGRGEQWTPVQMGSIRGPEDATYVTDALYARLTASAAALHDRVGPATAQQLEPRVARLLFWEARLLDMRRYREWLELLTEDCIYWVAATREPGDPRQQCGINFDDRRRLADRIALIETGALHAQTPPSRTCRMISNVECWQGEASILEVRSNTIISEYRAGRMTSYAGWQLHELVPEGDDWLIRKKVINLIDCDQPQGNVTFIL